MKFREPGRNEDAARVRETKPAASRGGEAKPEAAVESGDDSDVISMGK